MNRQRSAPSNGTPSLAKSKNGHRIRCGRPSRRSSNQNDRKWSQPSAHSGHSVRLSSTTAHLCRRFATTTMSGCQTSLANSFHNLGVFDVHGLKKTRLSRVGFLAKSNKRDFSCASAKYPRHSASRSKSIFKRDRGNLLLCTSREFMFDRSTRSICKRLEPPATCACTH